MVDLVYCLINFLFFDFQLLYYYINLRSLIIFYLSCGDIYLSLGISLLCSFVAVSELFFSKIFETFVILSVLFLPIKSPVASILFWIVLLEIVCICNELFEFEMHLQGIIWYDQEVFSCIYHSNFKFYFLPISLPIFLWKDKNS